MRGGKTDRIAPGPRVPEKLVRALWYEGDYRSPLVTTDGKRIEVLFPGRWNPDAGPDFLGARIRRFSGKGKRTIRGDVEVHVAPSDWVRHGHHRDPRFDGVVLHVVLDGAPGEGGPRTSRGRRPWMVVLRPRLTRSPRDLARREERRRGWEAGVRFREPPVAERLGPGGGDRLLGLVAAGGRRRLRLKARRFRAAAKRKGWTEALYAGLFAASGGPVHRRGFARLARGVPWSSLSGLLRARRAGERGARLRRLFAEAWEGEPPGGRTRIRPNGSGLRRIEGLAWLLGRKGGVAALGARAERAIRRTLRDPGEDLRGLRRRLVTLVMPPGIPWGRPWASMVAFNVLLPWLHAKRGSTRDRRGQEILRRLWADWPSLPPHRTGRNMAIHLWGKPGPPAGFLSRETAHQGLLALHASHCRDRMEECSRGTGAPCGLLSGGGPFPR